MAQHVALRLGWQNIIYAQDEIGIPVEADNLISYSRYTKSNQREASTAIFLILTRSLLS